MRKAWLIGWVAVTLALGCGISLAEKRVALVIGNSSYRSVPALPNPLNDAADIAVSLQRLGFTVTKLSNTNYDAMRRALLTFGRETHGSDVAVVFFAGHGMEIGGENWLIPVDAELQNDKDAEQEAISLRTVMAHVSNASKLGLVILDACRNNPFSAKMRRSNSTRAVERGLVRTEPTDNVLVAYAARDGTTANDGQGRNSPFTAALLKNIETPGLEITFMFRNVRDEVMQATRREQQPFVYGSLSKEAIYLKPNTEVQRPPVTAAPALPVPTPDEALWNAIKNATVAGWFEEFVRTYPNSPHAAAARARMEEMKKGPAVASPQVAAVAPPARPAPSPVTPVQPAVGVFPPASAAPVAVKVGVLSDMSSLYADIGGPGSMAAARLAIADFTGNHPNVTVEVLSGDHQNKPDVGISIASQWYERDKVDVIVDVPNSGVALAVSQAAFKSDKALILSGSAASDLTGPRCNANTVHWTYDTWMLANANSSAIVKSGGQSWFFLTADYAFGHALERDASAVIEQAGGRVLGKVRHPLNTSDFSSFLLQAQTSKANVIGLASAGGDTLNAIKQAAEFGIVPSQQLAALLVFASDVAALGLKTAQGLLVTESWYWDANEASRAWTRRWQAERKAAGKIPTMVHAGVYAGLLHYLKARVTLAGSPGGKEVVARMKQMRTDDPLFGSGEVRADGRKTHNAYLFEVKKPAESKYAGDIYKTRATIDAIAAFRPLKAGGCPLAGG